MTIASTRTSLRRRFSTKPPPSGWAFFTDRNLGRHIPGLLVQAGLTVHQHDEIFGPTTLDTTWLPRVGREGWIALSHDRRICTVPSERDMVFRAGVPLLVLVGKHGLRQLGTNLIATLPAILPFLARHDPPFIAKVHYPVPYENLGKGPGRVEIYLTKRDWETRPRNRVRRRGRQ